MAVLDTGIDPGVPDLAPNIWVNKSEVPANGVDDDGNGYIDDVNGCNFVNYGAEPINIAFCNRFS